MSDDRPRGRLKAALADFNARAEARHAAGPARPDPGWARFEAESAARWAQLQARLDAMAARRARRRAGTNRP